ncbi:MAG TPA: hypothetical protein VKP60_14300, partial [Magnetospirillaceae bacterium]|nr:hypothetical protein [Magnetospirillaceae bacterium]
GACLATLCNGTYTSSDHQQFLAVGLAPLAAWALYEAHQGLVAQEQRRFLLGGGAFVALYALWLMTAFYTAWFFLYFSVFALLFLGLQTRGGEWRDLLSGLRRQIPALAGLVALAALLNIPFLMIYLPKASQTGMRSFGEATRFAPDILDILHVGDKNLVWGRWDALPYRFFGHDYPVWATLANGVPLALFLLFLAACALFATRPAGSGRLEKALAGATIVTWILMARFGDVSLYSAVYTLFPGAKVIRVLVHYQLMLALPITALAMAFLARLSQRVPALVMGALAVFLVAEQLNHISIRLIDRPYELARLARIPPPPASCRSFYISRTEKDAANPVEAIYRHSVDAMFLSELLSLPTINGMDSYTPPNYDLYRPADADYQQRVSDYAGSHGLQGLCALDMHLDRWTETP